MGHLTVLDPDPDVALQRTLAARAALVAVPELTRRKTTGGGGEVHRCISLNPDGSGC